MSEITLDDWERLATNWLEGRGDEPQPLTTRQTLDILRLCKRARAIEYSITQGQERELREGYRESLTEILGI